MRRLTEFMRRAFAALTLGAVLLSLCQRAWVKGHGRLIDPPSRASMWRFGFNTNANYDDNQGYCGGREQLWSRFGGRCGVCGDPWEPRPRAHERGGRYFDGTPTRHYVEGDVITVVMGITANHRGWVEFRMCPYDWPSPEDVEYDEEGEFVEVSHTCLDKHVLQLADGSGERFYLPEPYGVGEYSVQVQLPRGISCQKCLFQWKWNVANSWGTNPDGESCVGCGPQEQFYACADIVIEPLEGDVAPDYPDDYPEFVPTPAAPPTYLPRARPQPKYPPQKPKLPIVPQEKPRVVPPWDIPDEDDKDHHNRGGNRDENGSNIPSGRNPATHRPLTITTTSLRTTTSITTPPTTTTTSPTTSTAPLTTTTAPPTTTTAPPTTTTSPPTTNTIKTTPKEKLKQRKPSWNKSIPSFWKWLLYNHPVKQMPQTPVVITKPTEASRKPTKSWWEKLMALADQTHVWGQFTGAELGRMELPSTAAGRLTTTLIPAEVDTATMTANTSETTSTQHVTPTKHLTSARLTQTSSQTHPTSNSTASLVVHDLPWWVQTVKHSGSAFLFHNWRQQEPGGDQEELAETEALTKEEAKVVAYSGLLGPSNKQSAPMDARADDNVVASVPLESFRIEEHKTHKVPKVQPYRSSQMLLEESSETLPPAAAVPEISGEKSRDTFSTGDQTLRAATPGNDFEAQVQNDFVSPKQIQDVSSDKGRVKSRLMPESNILQTPTPNHFSSGDFDFLQFEEKVPFETKDLICTPVGDWIQYPQMWRWCQLYCRGGYCPTTHCICA